MNLNEFHATYKNFKDVDKIQIECNHPEHVGDRTREIGKQAARRNIQKNDGERFVCRQCMMSHDNPMQRPRERRYTDELITVTCPHPEHVGPRERQIKKSAWFGSLEGPFEAECKSCIQLGKEISEEHKDAISKKLKGRELNPEHKKKIMEFRKNNPEWVEKAKKNLRPELGRGWNKGVTTPEKVRRKISEANKGKKRTEEQKTNISEGRKKMLQETGGFTKEHRENISKATIRQYQKGFNPNTYNVRGWHSSPKAGKIYFSSSYEKRAYLKLDQDESVSTYLRENIVVEYFHPQKEINANYIIDLKVEHVDGTIKWVEVKPASWLTDEVVIAKAEAAEMAAQDLGAVYEFWTELELWGSVYKPHIIQNFADKLRTELSGQKTDFEKERVKSNKKKAKKHYDTKIATDKVEVWCDYCQETHSPLRLTYEKNIKRNGEYICERKGGSIAGKKPKKKNQNPYAVEGKKLCKSCNEVKLFAEFCSDASRSDGFASRCRSCMAIAAKERYNRRKESQK